MRHPKTKVYSQDYVDNADALGGQTTWQIVITEATVLFSNELKCCLRHPSKPHQACFGRDGDRDLGKKSCKQKIWQSGGPENHGTSQPADTWPVFDVVKRALGMMPRGHKKGARGPGPWQELRWERRASFES